MGRCGWCGGENEIKNKKLRGNEDQPTKQQQQQIQRKGVKRRCN